MREIILTEKTGFNVKDVYKPVLIRDEKGLLFYNTESITPKVFQFNLPKGRYFLESGFIVSKEPIKYPLFNLPKYERLFYPNPKRFKIVFGDNPNKCSVLWDEKIIFFDNAFLEKTKPEFDFIKFHEFAHRFFETEKYCDLMAANYMLVKGYNPSQIGYSSIFTLSDNAYDRKLFLIKKIISYEQKYNV